MIHLIGCNDKSVFTMHSAPFSLLCSKCPITTIADSLLCRVALMHIIIIITDHQKDLVFKNVHSRPFGEGLFGFEHLAHNSRVFSYALNLSYAVPSSGYNIKTRTTAIL